MDKKRRNFILGTAGVAAAGLIGLSKTRQWFQTTEVHAAGAQAGDSAINSKPAPPANAKLGINPAGIADWGTEFPFLDLFKQSRVWLAQGDDADNVSLSMDSDGWITDLPQGVAVSAILSTVENRHFPKGEYVVLYEGEGDITVPGHRLTSAEPGRLSVRVDGEDGLFEVVVTKTNPDNYIKHIRVVPLAYEGTHETERWNPSFLKRWSGVACLRFMDFGTVNNSTKTNWDSRAKPTDATFVTTGVPVEWLVDLANRLDSDAWFCMPHQADDQYISQYAQYVSQHLKAPLRAWVEYSNEVWNGAFDQHDYARAQGQALNISENEWDASSFYAHRAVQMFKLWEDAFGGTKRLVRVLAAQMTYTDIAEEILRFKLPNNARVADHADVLAIANYVHFNIAPDDEESPNEQVVVGWTLDQLFNHLNKQVLPDAKSWLVSHKQIADTHGLKLVSYEAGQHLAAFDDATNNEKLTKLFLDANNDPRMGDVYAKSLADWAEVGGDLICSYASVGEWSKWGSWGLLQYHDDAPTAKFKATIDWAQSRGQQMHY